MGRFNLLGSIDQAFLKAGCQLDIFLGNPREVSQEAMAGKYAPETGLVVQQGIETEALNFQVLFEFTSYRKEIGMHAV